jgi:serine/threonine protein phosphatase 1
MVLSRLMAAAGLRSKAEAPPPEVPAGTRVYAIGDIHGRLDLLRQLNRQIVDDAAIDPVPRNVVVYLGDFVDRGSESSGVIDCLLDEALPGFETVHLRGNHEDSMLQFLGDILIGPAWLSYGGAQTLESYGITRPRSDRDLIRAQGELRQVLPERHRAFLRRLKLTHVEGGYLFVHAGIRPGVPLERQAPQDMLWIRDEFLLSTTDFGKVVVHGHTITDEPDVQPNRIGIDTGAFATNRLTCLVLQGSEMRFLQT